MGDYYTNCHSVAQERPERPHFRPQKSGNLGPGKPWSVTQREENIYLVPIETPEMVLLPTLKGECYNPSIQQESER
jgi:hypothetical protein